MCSPSVLTSPSILSAWQSCGGEPSKGSAVGAPVVRRPQGGHLHAPRLVTYIKEEAQYIPVPTPEQERSHRIPPASLTRFPEGHRVCTLPFQGLNGRLADKEF